MDYKMDGERGKMKMAMVRTKEGAAMHDKSQVNTRIRRNLNA